MFLKDCGRTYEQIKRGEKNYFLERSTGFTMNINTIDYSHKTLDAIINDSFLARFNLAHIIVSLYLLTKKPMGRYRLAKELALTEGITRTLITKLRKFHLVEPCKEKKKIQLTPAGKRVLYALEHKMLLIDYPLSLGDITISDVDVITILRENAIQYHVNVIKARDAAVLQGAEGCTILKSDLERFYFPESNKNDPNSIYYPNSDLLKILKKYFFKWGDWLVIGSAKTEQYARLGSVAASWTLISKNGENNGK